MEWIWRMSICLTTKQVPSEKRLNYYYYFYLFFFLTFASGYIYASCNIEPNLCYSSIFFSLLLPQRLKKRKRKKKKTGKEMF